MQPFSFSQSKHQPSVIYSWRNIFHPPFKKKLDEFLANIPNEPLSPGYMDTRRAASNSLLDMVQTSQTDDSELAGCIYFKTVYPSTTLASNIA